MIVNQLNFNSLLGTFALRCIYCVAKVTEIAVYSASDIFNSEKVTFGVYQFILIESTRVYLVQVLI